MATSSHGGCFHEEDDRSDGFRYELFYWAIDCHFCSVLFCSVPRLGAPSVAVRATPVGPDSTDPLKIGGGVAFRSAQDHGTVYFGLEDDYVVWPFAEFELKPTDRLEISGFGGVNNRDWLVKDSVRLSFNAPYGVKPAVGFKNHLGTTLNPLGDTYEYFDGDTLDLTADGYMQLHRLFFDLRRNADWFGMGFRSEER